MSGPTRKPAAPAGAARTGLAAAVPRSSPGKARTPPSRPPLRNSSRREKPRSLIASPPASCADVSELELRGELQLPVADVGLQRRDPASVRRADVDVGEAELRRVEQVEGVGTQLQ